MGDIQDQVKDYLNGESFKLIVQEAGIKAIKEYNE